MVDGHRSSSSSIIHNVFLALQKATYAHGLLMDADGHAWCCSHPVVSVSGVLGRGQNSGFVVHSATKDGETFAVKVSTECDEETVWEKLGTGEGSYLDKTGIIDMFHMG